VLILVVGFLMGAFVGSFLNVCIHRLPRNESVVQPPSRCYACGTGVRWHDNLPILSWLLLRGRCRFCQSPFSIRYCLGEAAMGVLTAAALWWAFGPLASGGHEIPLWLQHVGLDAPWASALTAGALLVLLWWLWVSAIIDLDHTIIPDELTKPMQLLAPGLALLLPLNIAYGWVPVDWFFTERGMNVVPAPWAGVRRLLWLAVPTLLVLAASVPLARWIYSSFCPEDQRWRDDDHRGFAIGVWWFLGVSGCHLLAVLVLAAVVDAQGAGSQAGLLALVQLTLAVLGSLVGWCSLYLVGLLGTMAFRRNALGFGDVKFLAPLGAVIGPTGILYTFFLASVIGALIGLPRRLLGKGREIPFGPFLALGAVLAAIFGDRIHALIFGGA
jgi:leader peptidase (prepilin peptidase)/N-methyltransferase